VTLEDWEEAEADDFTEEAITPVMGKKIATPSKLSQEAGT